MAYRVDRPEVNSNSQRLERWANNTTEQLLFALNDIEYRLNKLEEQGKPITVDTPTNSIYDLSKEIASVASSVDIISDNYTALEARVTTLEGE